MAVKLNASGRANARSLIAAGKVDKTSAWSFAAADGDALLGPAGDDWEGYARGHLGVDTDAADKTKARWNYPFVKDGNVSRAALVAIRDRAGQQHANDIFDAAGSVLHVIDGAKGADDDKGARAPAPSPLHQLYAELLLVGSSRILAIDEARALHQARASRRRRAAPGRPGGHRLADGPALSARPLRRLHGGLRGQLAQAVANPDVGAIVLDVDSPGGTYAGTPETAAAVRAANAVKPVTAVVDSLCASAAYFIASQAGQVVASPSSDLGSIGTLAVHHDFSQQLEREGIHTTIVRDPPFKAEGNPFEPLSDEALAYLQADVSAATAEFHRTVAQGRRVSVGKVAAEFGQGRTVGAQKAVDLGMADRVGTMADILSGIRTKRGAFRRRSAIAFT